MAPFTMIGSSARESAALLLGLVGAMAGLLQSTGSPAPYAALREVPGGGMSCQQLLLLRSARVGFGGATGAGGQHDAWDCASASAAAHPKDAPPTRGYFRKHCRCLRALEMSLIKSNGRESCTQKSDVTPRL